VLNALDGLAGVGMLDTAQRRELVRPGGRFGDRRRPGALEHEVFRGHERHRRRARVGFGVGGLRRWLRWGHWNPLRRPDLAVLQNGTLKTYKGFPHGCPITQAETINADLLAFLQS
jgi:hypothetical protein